MEKLDKIFSVIGLVSVWGMFTISVAELIAGGGAGFFLSSIGALILIFRWNTLTPLSPTEQDGEKK